MFLALAAVVYYYFCLLFYELCERAQENKGDHNFDTLRGTMITMYQVLLGEGWHIVMNDLYTVKLDIMIFFACIMFQFVMGILFTQLISGIIVNLYLHSGGWLSKGGEVYLLLGSVNTYLRSQSQEELEKLVHDLAALLFLLGVETQANADLPTGSMMELLTQTNCSDQELVRTGSEIISGSNQQLMRTGSNLSSGSNHFEKSCFKKAIKKLVTSCVTKESWSTRSLEGYRFAQTGDGTFIRREPRAP